MTNLSLNLIVFRTAEVNASLAFYTTIGLKFVQEQHGTGPVHYSCEVGNVVIEIYPGKPGSAPDRKVAGATLVGFQVTNLDEILKTLKQNGVEVLTPLQDSLWRRVVVQDPDGRAIELTEGSKSPS